jgi:hypothetical protein
VAWQMRKRLGVVGPYTIPLPHLNSSRFLPETETEIHRVTPPEIRPQFILRRLASKVQCMQGFDRAWQILPATSSDTNQLTERGSQRGLQNALDDEVEKGKGHEYAC